MVWRIRNFGCTGSAALCEEYVTHAPGNSVQPMPPLTEVHQREDVAHLHHDVGREPGDTEGLDKPTVGNEPSSG